MNFKISTAQCIQTLLNIVLLATVLISVYQYNIAQYYFVSEGFLALVITLCTVQLNLVLLNALLDARFSRIHKTLVLLQCFNTLLMSFYIANLFFVLFLAIVASEIRKSFGFAFSITLISLSSLGCFAINSYIWQVDTEWLFQLIIYSISLLAVVTSHFKMQEQHQKEQYRLTNIQLINTRAQLQEASRNDERLRILREFHDVLGHHLTALNLHLEVALNTTDNQSSIQQARDISKYALRDVRRIISEQRPKVEIDLAQAIDDELNTIPDVDIVVAMSPTKIRISVEQGECIVRCIQESVTNALKHADAKRIHISIVRDSKSYAVSITNPAETKAYECGNGIQGMRERVEKLNGNLNTEFNSNGEFCVSFILPIKEAI